MSDVLCNDPEVAAAGRMKIEWARDHMPVCAALRQKFLRDRPLAGLRVALSVHLEAKTACLAELLRDGGASMAVTGSNPLSTQDDVACGLASTGMAVFARHNVSAAEYRQHLLQVLDTKPQVIVDDGGDLVELLHTERADLAGGVIGGAEETTTGVLRLRLLEREGKLAFPMLAVNDARCKFLFDNRYGTGESVWSAIMRTTNLLVAGKTVVVMGYGWCGKGVALRARGLGAHVVVTEVDPVRAIEAHMDGYRVLPSEEAAAVGEVFITVSGCSDLLSRRHFEVMRDGALLANAGHFDVEINLPDLAGLALERQTVRPNIERFTLAGGRRLYLLAGGRLVNLAAGDGHPVEIMDLSFALQALSVAYLAERGQGLQRRVYPVPLVLDNEVAELKLASLGIIIDRLSAAQSCYLGREEEL
ncbi:MAG TPA: adenosylhomocysteinase [Spirochaetia bacterium]|nr:adenosylhomocysteinase [Spirochaetia bacterium]